MISPVFCFLTSNSTFFDSNDVLAYTIGENRATPPAIVLPEKRSDKIHLLFYNVFTGSICQFSFIVKL